MTCIDIISLISGVISIALAIYAIWYAHKESKQSTKNYENTKELLTKIETKSELIDRSVQLQQTQLIHIINKALDKVGQPPLEMQPLSIEEIDALFKGNKGMETTTNKAAKRAVPIGDVEKICTTIENALNEL